MSRSDDPMYLDARGVAERTGLAIGTIYSYLWRGAMPEPDRIWLRRPLWLPETIDEWRKHRYKRRKKMKPRILGPKARPQVVKPPRVTARAGETVPTVAQDKRAPRKRSSVGASASPIVSGVREPVAREISAALRSEGHYCTTEDVLALSAEAGELSFERDQLRERIRRKITQRSR